MGNGKKFQNELDRIITLFYYPFYPDVTQMRQETKPSPAFLFWKVETGNEASMFVHQ